MSLSPEQKEKVALWLIAKGVGPCPACGSKPLDIGDEFVASANLSPGGKLQAGGQIIPMVQVLCKNCGCVLHFGTLPMGIDP